LAILDVITSAEAKILMAEISITVNSAVALFIVVDI
jgi:hypothetical protein